MKIAITSDIHIKSNQDEGVKYLAQFVQKALSLRVEKIILLGDIFDLVCGPHPEYFKQYTSAFDLIRKALKANIQIDYFEGNHDLHLRKLFDLDPILKDIKIHQRANVYSVSGRSLYISHGDEHGLEDKAYLAYRDWLNSSMAKFIGENIMPYKALEWMGHKASIWSRSKGKKYYNPELVRDKFRHGVIQNCFKKYDVVIGGHCHVQDRFVHETEEGTLLYMNNGFAQKSQTLIFIDDLNLQFVPVD